MSSVIVAGDTSGSVTLQAPAVSGSTVLTLPTTTGTLVVNSGAQTIEFADGSASAPSITNSGDTNTGIFFPAADTIAFSEGGTESMRIDSSGNLGLGVTPSAWNTNVKSVQAPAGSLYSYSTVDLELTQNCYYSTGNQWIYSTTAPAERYQLYNGTHAWHIAPSGTAGNAITFTQAMTLDASGNLLVGTTTALGNVSTIAGANAIANSYGNLAIMSTDAQAADKGGQITFGGKYTTGGGDYFFGAIAGRKLNGTTGSAAGYLGFSTCSSGGTMTQQMTLDNSGNLTVAGTVQPLFLYMNTSVASTITTNLARNPSDGSFNLATRNGVAGSVSGTEIARLNWNYNGTDSAWISAERNAGTGANRINVVCNASAGVFLAAGGTSWGSLSDERQKTNLEPIADASNKLSTLRTVTGRYITDEETVSRAFLIAQDVQKVLPEAVDAQEDEDGTLGLRYTDLIPLLIAGFKEQQAMIDELKAKVAALEAA